MKNTVLVLLVALAGVAFTPVAHAEPGVMESNHFVSFGLGGGVSVPVSDAKDAFKTGFNGMGFARLNLKGLPITPRVDFTFSRFDVNSARIATPGVTGTGQLLAGLASLQFFLLPGPVRPYLIAGVGAYNFKTDVSGIPNAQSTSATKLGVNGGGGVVVKLGSVVSAYVEGRLDNVFDDKQGFVNAKNIQVVPVTFGIVF